MIFGPGRKVTEISGRTGKPPEFPTEPESHRNFGPGRKVTGISRRGEKSPEFRGGPESHRNFGSSRKSGTQIPWAEIPSYEVRGDDKLDFIV